MSLLILVVDDEPDVDVLFRQRFRRDLRAGRFTMEFAQSGPDALQRISGATESPADISELMFALTWGTGGEPKFTPILTESFDEIIGGAKSLVSPQG